jgi:hypothetical protein
MNFMCQQETKWVGEKAKKLDSLRFKHWYTGKVGYGIKKGYCGCKEDRRLDCRPHVCSWIRHH